MFTHPSSVTFAPPSEPHLESGPHAATDNPHPTSGRPRALDNAKRNEIIELLSGGFDLANAAKLVRCSVRTIRREMKRDPLFAKEVRRSEIFALQNPLGALQHALHKNWRTAAWLLERLFPERFGRRPRTTAFGKRQARQLLNEVLRIVDGEIIDIAQRDCINGRIRATFEYFTHVYCEPKRSKALLRRAIQSFEKKDKQNDLEWLASNDKAASSPRDPGIAKPQTISEAFQDLIDDLKACTKTSRSKATQNETNTDKDLSPNMSDGAFAADKMVKTISPQCAETPANSRTQVKTS